MKTIVIASQNPVKIRAALSGFAEMFPEEQFSPIPVSVPSGVSQQPMSEEETLRGALNRVANAAVVHPTADFWVGIEGGVAPLQGELTAFAWIVVRSGSMTGKGRTGAFFLPPVVAELVHQGKELGEADDQVFQKQNSKQENGAVGILTGNRIDRTGLYQQAVLLALIPFKNPGLYPTSKEIVL